MSGDPENAGSARVGMRRAARRQRERERRLTIRHRWYAGGIATTLSAALIFTGMSPASADVTPQPSEPAATQAPAEETPAEETPADQAPPAEAPAEETPPAETPAEETPKAPASSSRQATTDAAITPLSIPDPTPVPSGSTTLRVQKFGARTEAGATAPLAGATFAAYASTRSGARSGTPTATCTTDSAGQCEMVVPSRNSGSGGSTQGYWVYETVAPGGWDPVGNLGLGNYDSTKTSTPYSVFTNNVTGNSTIHLIPEDATAYVAGGTTSTTTTESDGFANVRENPAFPTDCGLSIAIVFDTSTSINSTEMSNMKSAALSFVGTSGLGGTPSDVALYRFSTTASKMLPLTSILNSQTAVNTSINSLPSSGDGYTNWDDAMRKIAFNGTENYDVVLFLTDGDPTVNGTNGSDVDTTIGFRNIEEGIFSANAVKSMTGPSGARTKVVAVGIGLATNSYLNLRAISGPTENEDYYTTDFTGLSAKLKQIALANCGGSVTVIKKTVDANGTTIDSAAGGWTFTGSTSGAWIKRSGQSNVSSLGLTTPSTDPGKGAVNFPIDLTGATSRTLTVTETVKNGFTPESVSCVGATATGTPASFSVSVTQNAIISCTVVNKQTSGKLTLKKVVDNGNTGATTAATAWTLSAAGPTAGVSGAMGNANVTNKTVLTGDYALSETGPAGYTASTWSCTGGTLTGSTVTVAKDANVVCTITNTAIEPKITLKKVVENGQTGGTAQPTAWTLTATGPTAGVSGTMGQAAVTAKVVKVGQYSLSESGGPGGYTSTGVWSCVNNGSGQFTGASTTATLAPGNDVTCTITNTAVAPKLTLKKNVDNKGGVGTRAATEWALTAGGASGWSGTTTGTAATASTAKQTVKAETEYTLGETGPGGYDASAWTCDSNITVTAGKITLPLGADATCQITNTVKTAKVTLVKKWVNAIQGDRATITAGSTSDTSVASGAAQFVDTANQVTLTLAQGSSVTLTEALAAGNSGAYGTTFSCTGGSVTGSGTSHTLTVPAADVTCTYTNTADTVTVALTKNWAADAFAGDTAALTITRGGSTLASSASTAPASQTINATVRVGDVVNLSEALGGGNTGTYGTSWVCIGATAPGANSLATGNLTVPAGGLSCTVTNTPEKVTVRVHKQWVNAFTSDAATITVNGTSGTSGAGSANETDSDVVVKQVRIGDTVTIAEALAAGNSGDYDARYACGTAAFANGASIPAFVASTDIACTFENTARTHEITLQKQWINAIAGDKATLSIDGGKGATSTANGNAGSWLDAGDVVTATVRAGDAVQIAETLQALSGSVYGVLASCTPTVALTPGQDLSFSLRMPDADVVCTISNSNVRGKLTLNKTVVNDNGGTAEDTEWTLTADGIVSISGSEGQSDVTNRFVPVGAYALSEANGPDGYTQTGLSCTGGAFTPATDDTPASVQVVAGANVVCEFTNNDVAPKLTLKKNVVNTGGGTGFATDWDLTAAGGTPWDPDTAGSQATSVTATQTVTAGVPYTLSEDGPDGYTASAWTCDAEGVANAGIVTLALGQNVTCEITNTAIPATGEHTKSVTSLSQADDGTWTIVYDITVRNTSLASTLTYDLSDELRFGSGIDVQDASWAGPGGPKDFDTPTSTVIATGATLPQNTDGNAAHVYTVTVHATIEALPGAQDAWQDCANPLGSADGGFLNESALTIGRSTVEAYACDEPGFPRVEKSAGVPTQNPVTGAWTVSYTIDVTTTGSAQAGDPAVHGVIDENLPSAPGAWVLQGGTWSVVNGPGTPELDVDLAPGDREIFAGHIPAGSHYSYVVTGVLTPTADAESIDPCDESGLVNGVTVSSGAASDSSDACVEIETPTVSVEKDALSVSQNPDGTWLVTYLVSVTNDSSASVAVYDLVDAPEFGTDAAADEVRWAPSNAAGEFDEGDLTTTTPIATGKVLAPHVGEAGVDHYVVQVTATVDPAAWTAGEGDVLSLPCPQGWEQNDSDAGGLLNGATATAGGESETDYGCTEPNLPTIVKTPGGAVQQEDPSQWLVTFHLVVTGQGTDTFYDLADVPDFVAGVQLISGSARLDGGDPVVVPLPVDGQDAVPFAEGVELGGSEVHEWVVSWLVDIPGRISPSDLHDCTTPGGGFDNLALLTVGGVEQTSDACIPVDEKVYPDLAKSVVDVSRDADTALWEITYRIDVTLSDSEDTDGEGNSLNPENLSSEYDLVDELQYGGIDIVDASWTGHDSGAFAEGSDTATLADAEPIAAGATHTYTVVVHASIESTVLSGGAVGCETFGGTRGIGFLNQATLSFADDVPPVVREACTPPAYPAVVKDPGTVTQNEDGTQRIEYFVHVNSPAPVEGQPVANVLYALQESPDALPAGVARVGDWHAEGVGEDTPEPSAATWNGTGTWNLQAIAGFSADDRLEGRLQHVYRIWTDVRVSEIPAELPEQCGDGQSSGIPLWNTVTLAFAEQRTSDDACVEVHYDDVSLVKSSVLPGEQDSVEPGDRFDYVLTVTNNGTRPATDVRVTDDSIDDRLEIVSIAVPGFTYAGGADGNDVDLTLNEPLPVGGEATVVIRVEFLPAEIPPVEDGGVAQAVPAPLDSIENTACVAADLDGVDENDCDDETVVTRDITAAVYTSCVNDAPLLGWTIRKSETLRDEPVSFAWTPVGALPTTEPANVTLSQPGGQLEWSEMIDWPGVEYTPSGVSIDYPGWRALRSGDYAPGGGYYRPGTTDVMTPAQVASNIFNGLILDDSELDYAWRGASTITFSVNPELTVTTSYPPASPECVVARHTDVQIEKTASEDQIDRGGAFTYDLAVENVSDDSAAAGVVVTDEIPAGIRITDITWPGQGDASVFPNWSSCEVTGQNGAGYGGTLECDLFGPLQPQGSDNGGATTAPAITLWAEGDPLSPATTIVNVGVVDYYTFGDPEDTGRDADDATVRVPTLISPEEPEEPGEPGEPLPATGGAIPWSLALFGVVALVLGTAMLVVRRRRGEARPTL